MKLNNIKKFIFYSGLAVLVFSSIYTGASFNNALIIDSVHTQNQLEDTQFNYDQEPNSSPTLNN